MHIHAQWPMQHTRTDEQLWLLRIKLLRTLKSEVRNLHEIYVWLKTEKARQKSLQPKAIAWYILQQTLGVIDSYSYVISGIVSSTAFPCTNIFCIVIAL